MWVNGAVFQRPGDGDPWILVNWGGRGYRCDGDAAFLGFESVPSGMFSGVVTQVSMLKMSRASSWISGWVIATPRAIELAGRFR